MAISKKTAENRMRQGLYIYIDGVNQLSRAQQQAILARATQCNPSRGLLQ